MKELQRWFDKINTSIGSIYGEIVITLPTLFSFMLILVLGFIVSYILKKIVFKILQKSNLLLKRLTTTSETKLAYLPEGAIKIISKVVFWVSFFFFFMAALHFTGFQKIDLGLNRFVYLIPNLFTAGAIFFVGWFISLYTHSTLADFCTERSLKQGPYISGGIKWLVIIASFDIALMQLGIKTSLINNLILLFVGAFLGGLVISFALGSREFVENLIACHTLQRHYEVGQKIRLETIDGTILKFTSTSVVLVTRQGQALVPAKSILQTHSILLPLGAKK